MFHSECDLVPVQDPSREFQPAGRCLTACSHDPRVNDIISERRMENSHRLLEADLNLHGLVSSSLASSSSIVQLLG